MNYLIVHGAKLEEINNFGESPLHVGALKGFPEIVKILLEHSGKGFWKSFNSICFGLFCLEMMKLKQGKADKKYSTM